MMTKTTLTMIPVGLVSAAIAIGACADRDPVRVESRTEHAAPSASRVSAPGKNPMILNLLGTGVGETRTLVIDGVPTSAQCFTVDLVDVANQRVVGKGTDCLVVRPDDQYPDGLEVIGTTIFDFGDGNTFTSRGLTSVQPKTHGSPDVTHITGAIPPAGENSVIDGTGRFARLRARVRLSGAVDMSRIAQNVISFDCIFVVHPL